MHLTPVVYYSFPNYFLCSGAMEVNFLVFKVNSKVYEKEIKEVKEEGNRMVTF